MDKVYGFLYNSMTEESASRTMSIHKTRKGAEMAMEFHKSERKKEWDIDHKREPNIYTEFGYFEWWGIEEMEINN